MKKHIIQTSLALPFALTLTTEAAITYVDATATNTSTIENTTPTAGTAPSNNQWHIRSGFGADAGVIVSGETSDSSELQTTATIPNGTYNVFAYYWDSPNPGGSNNWDIQAGFTSGNLTSFESENVATDASQEIIPDDTFGAATTGSADLIQISLGEVTVTDGNLVVYIDDEATDMSRTWYDGIGYEAVPEPSTALLAIIGLLGLTRRRR